MTDLVIYKGSTFTRVVRWASLPYVYTPITAITKAAPVVITAAAHGLRTGWPAAVVSPGGMRQIKAKRSPPLESDMHRVTRVDVDRVSFNEVDSTSFTTYTSGGSLASFTPVDLAGFTARMMVRSTAEDTGTPLLSLVSPTDIVLDNTEHTITVTIDAATTAAITWEDGVFDLELVSSGGVVTKVLSGNVTAVDEVTR